MGAVSSIFATVQEPPAQSLPTQTDLTFSPEASAPPTVGAAQQDTVTLAGRTAEGQQTRAGNDNGQSGEAAAFFFAEKQSFRAGSGSGGSQTAQTPSVPQLPVKIVEEPAAGQEAAGAQSQENSTNATSASAAALRPDSSEIQQTSSASGTTEDAETPIAELAQLDDTLQQMGVNPQSISLFNRMAMVLYANDPAALRVLVQTLQSGAQQLTGSNSGDTTSGTNASDGLNASSSLPFLPQQPQLPAGTVGENIPEIQTLASDKDQLTDDAATDEVLRAEPRATSQGANTGTPGSVVTTGANEPNQQAGPSELSVQLEGLNSAFAAVGAQQSFFSTASSSNGQLLNVTF